MRLNKYIALATGMSRRSADDAVESGRIHVNGKLPQQGAQVSDSDTVTLDGRTIVPNEHTTIMFHKPKGYVCSRDGQGSKTIYDILPEKYHHLKPVGRLDKNSSGLLLLTNNGDLANSLTHPSSQKTKTYEVTLNQPLQPLHRQMISDFGIKLEDGISKFELERRTDDDRDWLVIMREGRNRQIRRTFAALDYRVIRLHRTKFGPHNLSDMRPSEVRPL